MRVLVCGDRNWNEYGVIKERLSHLPLGSVVIHGGCRGADVLAGVAALALGFPVLSYPANWETYGKSAGPIRNQMMLDDGEPDLVIAFHHDLINSSGTWNMVKISRQAGVPVEIVS
jgi:hypothetical protein